MWNYKIELSICRWTVKRNEHVLDNYYKSTSLLSPIPTPPCLRSLKTCIGLMACSTQTPPSSWGELMSLWISQAFQFLDHLIFINHFHSTLDTHSHGDVITLNFPIFEIFVPKIPLSTALSFDLKEFFKHLVNPFLSLLLFRKILDCMFISSVVLLSIPKFLAPLSFHHGHLRISTQAIWHSPFSVPTADHWLSTFLSLTSSGFQCCLEILPAPLDFFHFHQPFTHNNLSNKAMCMDSLLCKGK